MGLRDRIRRGHDATAPAQDAEPAGSAADAAWDRRVSRAFEAPRRARALWDESPCPELLEAVRRRIVDRHGERAAEVSGAFVVEVRWDDARRRTLGGGWRRTGARVTAEMHADGTLIVRGKRPKRFALDHWRRNPQAVERAFDEAYAHPERVGTPARAPMRGASDGTKQ